MGNGWNTAAVARNAPMRVLAGRREPSGAEALLIDLRDAAPPAATVLPQGGGFSVEVLRIGGAGTFWLCVARKESASLEIFSTMVEDLMAMLRSAGTASPGAVLRSVLDRIRAWQLFMDQARNGLLGPEQEVGLVGELHVVSALLRHGVPGIVACEGWTGPLDGLHDFRWPTGAIEVKTTTTLGSFPARVHGPDQLDDGLVRPLILAAVRIAEAQSGDVLSELVHQVRELLGTQAAARSIFDERLLAAGFLDLHAERYSRRFRLSETRYFVVDEHFPRLTRALIPAAVTDVRYTIDLDAVASQAHPLLAMIVLLGAN